MRKAGRSLLGLRWWCRCGEKSYEGKGGGLHCERRNHLPLQWEEVMGWKGNFTRKGKVQGDLSEWKVYYCLPVLLPNCGCQPFCVTCVCIEYLKKCKHVDKSIANYSVSIKHCIDKGHSLLQTKCWIKMARWKIHQENINLVKKSLLKIVHFTSKMCITKDLESHYLNWYLLLY